MPGVDDSEVLAAFDTRVRRDGGPPGPTSRVEHDGDVVRLVAASPAGFSAVLWSALTEASADPAIARQLSRFGGIGHAFEWKWYAHDPPPDLPRRLLAAGFEAGEDEALMVAEVAGLPSGPPLPPGVTVRRVRTRAEVDALVVLHDRVFGGNHGRLGEDLAAHLDAGGGDGAGAGGDVQAFLVEAVPPGSSTPEVVAGARMEIVPGTGFAGLWGGGTLPGWRGRGLYRALVAHRAAVAAARGVRWLQVDASPESEPVLARLGFARLSTTVPYTWHPPGAP